MASFTHDNLDIKATEEGRTSRPPQFALRTLLAAVAALAMMLALLQVGAYIALFVAFIGVLIAAHVAGNVIGTNLREQSPTRVKIAPDTPRAEPPVRERLDLRPSQLVDHLPIDRRVFTSMVAAGLVAAAATTLLTIPMWDRVGVAGIAIMVASTAIIGCFFGFMAVRLVTALRRAFQPRERP
jgi:hypothetical protein